jgi:hypothetical protein
MTRTSGGQGRPGATCRLPARVPRSFGLETLVQRAVKQVVRASGIAKRAIGHTENNTYEELRCALHQLGWRWLETSAFELVTSDISKSWKRIGLIGRQVPLPGELTALNFAVQCKGPMMPSSLKSHPNALAHLKARPSPF